MFEVRKEGKIICAGHHIEGHTNPLTGEPGKCQNPHGHNYSYAVIIQCERLNEFDMVIDYYVLGAALDEIHRLFDHKILNDFPCFQFPHKSTAERFAAVIYESVGLSLVNFGVVEDLFKRTGRIAYTEVQETDGTYARYYPLTPTN